MSFERWVVVLFTLLATTFYSFAQENPQEAQQGDQQGSTQAGGQGNEATTQNGNPEGTVAAGGEQLEQTTSGGQKPEDTSTEKPWDGENANNGEEVVENSENTPPPMVLPWNIEHTTETEGQMPLLPNQIQPIVNPPLYNPGAAGENARLALPNVGSPNQLSPYTNEKLEVMKELPWNENHEE